MNMERKIGHAPRTVALAQDLAGLNVSCMGCKGCGGLCAELIDALIIPKVILGQTAR